MLEEDIDLRALLIQTKNVFWPRLSEGHPADSDSLENIWFCSLTKPVNRTPLCSLLPGLCGPQSWAPPLTQESDTLGGWGRVGDRSRFRREGTCVIPVADSCWCRQKPTRCCGGNYLLIKKKNPGGRQLVLLLILHCYTEGCNEHTYSSFIFLNFSLR